MSPSKLIGYLPYYSSYYNWKIFNEKMEQYFILNDIQDNVRAGLLLTSIEDESYILIRDLCYPKLPKDKNYNELIEIMQNHISARSSSVTERVKFHRAEQEENETVKDWIKRVNKLGGNCKFFDEFVDLFLLEKFISGLRPGVLLDRLCEEQHQTLTFTRATEIAVTIENAIETSEQ